MNNKKILYVLILLLPIIDTITGLTERLFPNILSVGLVIKGILLLYLVYKLLFLSSKYKRIILLYLMIILVYVIGILVLKITELNISNIIIELKYLFKLLYFPTVFSIFICYFDSKKFSKEEIIKLLKMVLIEYSILLFIPLITNTAFSSYTDDIVGLNGKCGWFYSANEISIILILLFPFIYNKLEEKSKYYLILPIVIAFLITSIGTKSSVVGLVIESVIMLIINIIRKNKKLIIYSSILFLTIIICSKYSVAINNFSVGINVQNKQNIMEKINKSKKYNIDLNDFDKWYPEDAFTKFINKYGKTLLSDRDIYFKLVYKIYKNNFSIKTLLLGIGYTDNVNTDYINKLVEIDIIDIFFHSGLIALVIVLLPFIYYLVLLINSKKININIIFYTLIIFMILGVSCISGHTLMAPAVSIYLSLYFILGMNELGLINRKDNKTIKNRVTIYALHLNYGGVEKNVCTKANILSEVYDVEIISLYKLNEEPSFKLNKSVKVRYLTENIKPNRVEFKEALKRKKIISIFKEGFKSVYILYLKNTLLIKSMVNCNSSIIISTRIDFTLKLIKNNEYNNIKIAEEHIYHNNNTSYLNKLNKVLKHVDYLMPSSEYLTNYYKKLFTKYSYKIVTNNMPIETDKSISNLKNKIIISVGRLDKVKAFDELIKIFKKVNNKDWKLVIVGDGPEYNNLNNLIKELKLDNNVELVGFKTSDELNKLYKDSSIYIMTSIEESFGLVLLEASSHGLPIVAYSSALGAKEILSDNSGVLIDNRNESLMVKALKDLMNNPNQMKELQRQSLRLAIKYDYDSIKDKVIEFYKDVKSNDIYSNLYTGTKTNCYKLIDNKLKDNEKQFIITANPETYMLSCKDSIINNILYNRNNLVIPDGISIVKTANFLGYDIRERITGVDLAEHLLKTANKNKYKVYLFGASNNVIEKLESVINEKYPNIDLVGSTNGYIKDKDSVMKYISMLKPDIVLVALGIPMQEKLIYNHINEFDKGIFVGVGGSFDVLSGSKKRAPKIFIKLNLEWLYRLLREPKRIIRFLKHNIRFLTVITKEKIYKNVDK